MIVTVLTYRPLLLYLLQPQTIAPGAVGSTNARLFAGAKELSVVGIDFPFGPGG
jgi:YidC/Oxa1 family membrane protein insertase